MLDTADIDARTVDPVTFEILSHRLHQITKEVGTTLERVGGTVNTTQMHDYMSALYRANGDILAGEGGHAASAGFAVKHVIERFADDDGIEPGDMFLLNDPYIAAIHQSDVYIMAPVHFEGQLVAWSATFVHVMDIGAMSPGGDSPGATEICHEGVRIGGLKLIERGKLRRDVFDAITNMTRQPAMVALDLKCEIAANNVARTRIEEMYAQYGPELVDAVTAAMLRYSEQTLRKRLTEIADGSWTSEGTIEVAKEPLSIKLRLDKEGDHLRFDFTGTAPQAKVGINRPYHATLGSCSGALMRRLGWDIPKNHGAFAPIEVIAPPGTIMSAQYPAPVSIATTGASAVASYVEDSAITQMVATSEKWGAEVMAEHLGGRRARHAGVNQYGRYYTAAFGGLRGGGARGSGDGIDTGGRGVGISNIEWVELNFPLLYLFRRHSEDGAGAGKYRGGAGEEFAVTVHDDAPEGRIKGITYGVAGLRNSSQGIFGGYPSPPSLLVLSKGTKVRALIDAHEAPVDLEALGGDASILGYTEFDLARGDVLFMNSPSGGGYGDPLHRDPAAVAKDVRMQLVSPEAARDVYGVVVAGNEVDAVATDRRRQELWTERTAGIGADSPTLLEAGDGPVHPLRENLEVAAASGVRWVRCSRCKHVLCRLGDDWKQAAHRRVLPADKASPVFRPFVDQLVLEQHCCPSCGALLNTELLEERANG